MIHVATIRSKITTKVTGGLDLEAGIYESEVYVSLDPLVTKGDPRGYVKHQIAVHLAGCVKATLLPTGEQLWDIHFTDFAQKAWNFPRGFTA